MPEILEDASNGLTEVFRRLLDRERQPLLELDAHIDEVNTVNDNKQVFLLRIAFRQAV